MFCRIKNAGGIVGISLYRLHLTNKKACGIDTIITHIEHYLSLGGEKTVCLGCDLDGIPDLPDDIEDIGDIYKIADRLSQLNYPSCLIEDIFFNNANNFVKNNKIIPELNI
jgi:membrane dipeptidase